MMNNIDISIIIPVYYNEGSRKKTYQILKNIVFIHFPELTFEIIFIDDGSGDNSYKEMCSIKEMDHNIKLIQFTRNFGQVPAFYAGYELSQGNGILNLSADLQDPPELIISIIESYIKKEAMIIAGKRIDREESYYRKKTSQLFYYLMKKLSFTNMPNGGFDVVLIDKKVKKFILNSKESNPSGRVKYYGQVIV